MLREIAEQLDRWIIERNFEAEEEGLPQTAQCTIKVLGQTALMESGVALALAATNDVDVQADYSYPVQKEFERLLAQHARTLDPVSHEIWMPRETRYRELFSGRFVRVLLADADAVLLSKALKAPDKNRVLITEYLALGASDRFYRLAQKYGLDLEQFL
jgi:hypothetical protein